MAKTAGLRVARGKAGREAAWKQSKFVAMALVGVIVVIWIGVLWWWLGGGQTYNISDFPHTFMPEDGQGEPLIIKADTNSPPRAPFQKDGKWYWEAYVCKNKDCPGKKGDKPFIFPAIDPWIKDMIKKGKYDPNKPMSMYPGEMGGTGMPMPMPPPMYGMMECPKCKAAKKESFHVGRYYTPEGQKMLDEMIKKAQAASGGK